MWTAWLLLTLNGLFFTLRLAGNTGSFPRALKPEEEREYLERYAAGDQVGADSVVLEGVCRMNEALLTGESDAVERTAGEALWPRGIALPGWSMWARRTTPPRSPPGENAGSAPTRRS